MLHSTVKLGCHPSELPDVITVSDSEMVEATRLSAERMKLVLELSAGAVVAAALRLAGEDGDGDLRPAADLRRVGVVLCGGNVDVSNLPWMDGRDGGGKSDQKVL